MTCQRTDDDFRWLTAEIASLGSRLQEDSASVTQVILDAVGLQMAWKRGFTGVEPIPCLKEAARGGGDPLGLPGELARGVRRRLGAPWFPGASWRISPGSLGPILGFLADSAVEQEDVRILGALYHSMSSPVSRKDTGVYYSPQPLVKHLVDSTLGKSLQDLEEALGAAVSSGDEGLFLRLLDRARAIRLVDPAMGTGAFLLECFEILSGFYRRVLERAKALSPSPDFLSFLEEIGENLDPIVCSSLYGVDIDARARDLTAFAIAVSARCQPESIRPVLVNNLKVGNALVSPGFPLDISSRNDEMGFMVRERLAGKNPGKPGWAREIEKGLEGRFQPDSAWSQVPRPFIWELEFPEVFFDGAGTRLRDGGFSFVLGNPPWSRLKGLVSPREKAQMAAFFGSRYSLQRGNHNLYKLFLELALEVLSPGGKMGQIVPGAFLGEESSAALRRAVFERLSVEGIVRIPKDQVKSAFQASPYFEAALVWGAAGRKESCLTWLGEWNDRGIGVRLEESGAVSGRSLVIPRLRDASEEWGILESLSRFPRLESFLGEGASGEGPLHESHHGAFLSRDPDDDVLIRRMRIHRYFLDLSRGSHWKRPMFVAKDEFIREKPGCLKEPPFLVCREVLQIGESRRLQFAIVEAPHVLGNSVRYLKPGGVDPHVLLALLNSSLLEWYFRAFSYTYHVKGYELLRFPVPHLEPDAARLLGRGARHMLSSKGQDIETDRALDRLVYALYSLGDRAVGAIERSLGIEHPLPDLERVPGILSGGEGCRCRLV